MFGLGPREVKLSQEALEVLALVAYRQPITTQEIEELGKARPSGVLRQLLRRELIAIEVGVPLQDVEMMEGRLSGSDFSLNATQSVDDEGREWIDALEDDGPQAAETVENAHDNDTLRQWLLTALTSLNDREQFIVRERKLRDEPRTLESLGSELGLSKERVRQLEAAAFTKMRKSLEAQSSEVRAFFR